MSDILPLLKPSCSDLEIQYVTEVLRSGWWGLGKKTEEFEHKFAQFTHTKYAVGVNSATAALDLALKAHGVLDGEVIVPAITFISTALAGIYNNCKVVLADVNDDLCIDWDDVESKITKKTKAIIPVHYGGKHSEVRTYPNIVTIEDCAHAGGTVATWENTSCWSFHAVKNIATGDGGMITTNDESIYKKLLPLRWCGIDKTTWERANTKYGWDYQINSVGYKCHMNDISAALGLAQLERIEELNNKRKLRVLQYLHELKNLSWLILPKYDPTSSNHLFVVKMYKRNQFIDYMLAHGISVGVHYKPLYFYPFIKKNLLPNTEKLWESIVTLPLYPDMTDSEFSNIVDTIKKYDSF